MDASKLLYVCDIDGESFRSLETLVSEGVHEQQWTRERTYAGCSETERVHTRAKGRKSTYIWMNSSRLDCELMLGS
jgi:hypothetical protein